MALHGGTGRGPGHMNRLPQGSGGGTPPPSGVTADSTLITADSTLVTADAA